MRTVFADSFYFFALLNDRDPAHEKEKKFEAVPYPTRRPSQ